MAVYFFAILASFLLAAGLTPIIKRLAARFGVFDDPQAAERKIHRRPIPLLGGMAVMLSSSIIVIVFSIFNLADYSLLPAKLLIGILVASVVIMIGGALDDKYILKPGQQIVFPLAAVAIVIWSGLNIMYVTNPLGDTGAIVHIGGYLGLVLAAIWLLGMMYTTKFLDGLDGLATGIGVIAAIFIFLVSLRWDEPLSATGVWALALAGAGLGFLIYNWQPAKIFLGEGGSIYFGFILGVLSILSGSKIITTLLVMGIPILDVLWVIVQRIFAHRSPFSGDRTHIHYRLLDLGLTPKQIVLLLYLIAIGFGSLGFISSSYGKMVLVFCLIAVMVILSTVLKFKSKEKI